MQKPDNKILKACRHGDRKAQFELYRLCYPALMEVCQRYLENEQEAAAILNEGFYKILKNIHRYSDEKPFVAWCKRIMINTIIDNYRRSRKYAETLQIVDFQDVSPDSSFSFNEAEELLKAEDLLRMLKELSPMTRQVFNLFAIDELKHKEIADLLGISEGTSKWHLSNARKKLMKILEEQLNSPKILGYGK